MTYDPDTVRMTVRVTAPNDECEIIGWIECSDFAAGYWHVTPRTLHGERARYIPDGPDGEDYNYATIEECLAALGRSRDLPAPVQTAAWLLRYVRDNGFSEDEIYRVERMHACLAEGRDGR